MASNFLLWTSILFFLTSYFTLGFKTLENTMSARTIRNVIKAVEQAEGVGAKVRRSIGTMSMRNFNPFLMLDDFSISADAGFPEHPHLGQETITLVLLGAVAHEDFTGSKGVLYPGDLQFMTAGKGVVHSEMPVPQKDGSPIKGMQLWVDLPESLKECEPRYRDLKSYEIPEAIEQDGKLRIKVISGKSYGVESLKDLAYTPVHYYYVTMKPGASFKQDMPKDFNFFLYVREGDALVVNGDTKLQQYDNCFFNMDGDGITVENPSTNSKDAEFVLVGGKTLDQEVVQYGPFVATNQNRIQQAFMDYRSGRNGFDNIKTWDSLISNGVTEDMVKGELKGSLEQREKEKSAFLRQKGQTRDEL